MVSSHATDKQKAAMQDDIQECQKIMYETKKDITSEQKENSHTNIFRWEFLQNPVS